MLTARRASVNTPEAGGEPEDIEPIEPTESDGSLDTPPGSEAGPSLAENTSIQRIVQDMKPEDRAQLFGLIRQESMSHSGWLPTPGFMRQYDGVLPGLAERIVAMPEREQNFRHTTTKDIVKRDYSLRATGQWMGMAALVLILAFCAFLAILGGIAAAASVAGVTIVGTVGIFVAGQVTGKSGPTSKELVESDSEEAE